MTRILAALILTLATTASAAPKKAASARSSTPEDQMRGMAGCYSIDWEFIETFDRKASYPIHSPPYAENGFESVILDKDVPGQIHLQHLLLLGGGVLKHWRQEWIKESPTIWNFMGGSHWTRANVTPIDGAWLQRVTQVDDSPQYDCQASWSDNGQQNFWECISPSPVPRRESSIRDDYDLTLRRSRLSLTDTGWIQEEDNSKVQSASNTVLTEEKGFITYKRVDDAKCANANAWWAARKNIWNFIQDEWTHIYDTRTDLVMKDQVNGQYLMDELDTWAEAHMTSARTSALQAELEALITKYIQ